MKINILGCGSATPSLRHLPACQVVEHRGQLMMIDCGEGAQLSMRRQGLNFGRLNHIFISHLHGDHCLGLPGLLSTLALQQKGGTITVHTFAEGADLFGRVMDFICRERPYELKFNILTPGQQQIALETDSLGVEAFPLHHRVPTLGFIMREKPKPRHLRGDMAKFLQIPVSRLRGIKEDGDDFTTPDGRLFTNEQLTTPADPSASYAYCSDTAYFPELAQIVEGVDLLYHESTYDDSMEAMAAERHHSTASQAARIARDAHVGQLLLGHFSKRYNSEELLLQQARAIFPNTIAANEGMTIELSKD